MKEKERERKKEELDSEDLIGIELFSTISEQQKHLSIPAKFLLRSKKTLFIFISRERRWESERERRKETEFPLWSRSLSSSCKLAKKIVRILKWSLRRLRTPDGGWKWSQRPSLKKQNRCLLRIWEKGKWDGDRETIFEVIKLRDLMASILLKKSPSSVEWVS